jgi:riboflavin biosynthesis pyrimidine reductase
VCMAEWVAVEPIETLEGAVAEPLPLPADLQTLYGGGLDLSRGTVYANFVSSIDGVVALGVHGLSSGGAISGKSEADRFVMGLLRACAACVVVGASTLRDDSGHLWTPSYIHPPSARLFAELREMLGLRPEPVLVVVTNSGQVDPGERAFQEGALLFTTESGAARAPRLPPSSEVVVLAGGGAVDAGAAMAEVRRRFGSGRVLTEGGPHVIGWLLGAGLLDELFLTVSPVLAGRDRTPRAGLVAGLELLPDHGRWAHLRSVKRHGDHLFLRYDARP